MLMPTKREILQRTIEHIDIKQHNGVVALVDAMETMAFSSRDLHRASSIYERMLRDKECAVILCLAGSLISSGLKQVFVDLIRNNMVDAIVSTGANIVDQDFFESLGFRHYVADELYKAGTEDSTLRELMIDRIYDTLIDEEELRICDDTLKEIVDSLEPRPYSSREVIVAMGAYLEKQGKIPARRVASMASSGQHMRRMCRSSARPFLTAPLDLDFVAHQHERQNGPKVSIDSAKDFYELTKLKMENPTTGLLMIGGGVPKNFAQDIVVAADVLGVDASMHKYAIQVTVADVRDGALSSSTLKEASSWGKVDTVYEQMVFAEATLAVPLIAGYAFHKKAAAEREGLRLARVLDPVSV